MQIGALMQRWAHWSARVFPQRDVIIRSNDRVRQWRIRPWHQKLVAATGAVLAAWFLVANLGLLLQSYRVANRDTEIAERQLAYLDLMEEVSGYQSQFSRIAEALHSDQALLLEKIGPSLESDQDVAAIGEGLARQSEAAGQVALARETLRARLSGFEGNLRQVARQSESLRTRVDTLRAELSTTRQERQAVAAARLELGARLEETQQRVALQTSRVRHLRETVATLEADLAKAEHEQTVLLETQSDQRVQVIALEESVSRLSRDREGMAGLLAEREGELSGARGEIAAVSLERDRFAGGLEREREAHLASYAEITRLEMQLEQAISAHDGVANLNVALGDKVARLRNDLAERNAALAVAARRERDLVQGMAATAAQLDERRMAGAAGDQRNDALREEVETLEARIGRMGAGQEALVARYRDLAGETIGTFEKTIAMTGLEVQNLMTSLDERFVPRGGPFVAQPQEARNDWTLLPYLDADGQPSSLGPTWLEVSMSNLDLQLDRWEGLQEILGAIPLAPPLEEYDITSSFGFRYDPVNGRKASHEGTDFGAPNKTSVYSTAPGRVVTAGWKGHFGRMVEIDHGHGITTRYAHLRSILVERGEQVGNRQKIGLVGSSGRSTGSHLHYGVIYLGKAIDPQKFLLAGKNVFKE